MTWILIKENDNVRIFMELPYEECPVCGEKLYTKFEKNTPNKGTEYFEKCRGCEFVEKINK